MNKEMMKNTEGKTLKEILGTHPNWDIMDKNPRRTRAIHNINQYCILRDGEAWDATMYIGYLCVCESLRHVLEKKSEEYGKLDTNNMTVLTMLPMLKGHLKEHSISYKALMGIANVMDRINPDSPNYVMTTFEDLGMMDDAIQACTALLRSV